MPMSEMLTYGVDLTAMTQGRGSFNMEMHHYDVVPGQLQEKIVEKAKSGAWRCEGRRRVKRLELVLMPPSVLLPLLTWPGARRKSRIVRL